jgi:hypothetical protein
MFPSSNNMDIDSLTRLCLRNIQKAPVNRPQISAHQRNFHPVLELLERLEQAELSEQENYNSLNQDQSEDNEPPILMVPSLPSLQPLLSPSDNPKDIIFDAFLSDQTIPSLTTLTPNRLSLLLKAVPLAVNAQALLPEECALLGHFLEYQQYDHLQTFLYQKLMHGYIDSPNLYQELVLFLIQCFPSFEVAGEVIRRLPLITDEIWKYIWTNASKLLHLLRELVLTYEEGSKGIGEIFSMIESPEAEVQDHAIKLIANQLYTICPDEINLRTTSMFEQSR